MDADIPHEIAVRICDTIYERNRKRILGIMIYQCKFCRFFAKNNYDKMCFHNKKGNGGCNLINKEFRKKYQ